MSAAPGALTCGERAVRALLGQPIDRAPFGVGIGWFPWGEALERWRRESGDPNLDPTALLQFEPSFAIPAFHPGIFPGFKAEVLEESPGFVIHRDERGIVMRNRRDGGSMPEFLEHPVTCRADWERLKAERLDPSAPGRITEDWPAFRARIASTGEAVQVGWFPYGVFGTPRDLLGVESLLVMFIDEPDLIMDMMEHLTTLWLSLWRQVAAEVRIDHIHIWEDMCGRQGSLISPRMVRRFMMPCYDRIVAFAHEAGARIVSVDTDGDCSQVLPVMHEHGINAMLPFEVQAGCDVLAYRDQYPDLGIWGGLDKRALAAAPADLDVEVERCAEMLRRGRYIPSFDHLIPPDASWHAFRSAAERIRELCLRAGSSPQQPAE